MCPISPSFPKHVREMMPMPAVNWFILDYCRNMAETEESAASLDLQEFFYAKGNTMILI